MIKTIDFLPLIFQTPTNRKFLNATLDQLVSQPDFKKVNGYIGRKFAPTFKKTDNYVSEPTNERQNYQLEPSCVSVDSKNAVNFFSSYSDLLQQIKHYGGLVNNHDRLFGQESYSFDGRFDFDKFVNFDQYYWLPNGPAPVTVFADPVDTSGIFDVTRNTLLNAFTMSAYNNTPNPQLILARGGTYQFNVNQPGFKFWIQADQDISGERIIQPNINTRNVLGVINNGTDNGTITFTVPQASAQDSFVTMPIVKSVDLATNLRFIDLNNQLLSHLVEKHGGIDGVSTGLNGKYFIFNSNDTDNSHWVAEDVYALNTYSTYPYDLGPSTIPAGMRTGIWQIRINNTNGNDIVQLTWVQDIPVGQKVFVKSGADYANFEYYKNVSQQLQAVPLITAPLDKIYYSDESDPSFYGEIRIVDPLTFSIDVESEILGKTEYTSPNGVVFTNGLKVKFGNYVTPAEYANQKYYVERVGKGIRLVNVDHMVTPELNKDALTVPFDVYAFDMDNFDEPIGASIPEYMTINRSSIDINAWSRSNRWFHGDVIIKTAEYNNTVPMFDQIQRAKQPIIEFNEDMLLFNSGRVGIPGIDVVDFTTSNAMIEIQNSETNLLFKEGETIIFANDSDPMVRSKIYRFNVINQLADTYYTNTTEEVNAGSFIMGEPYSIVFVGTTDFGTVGAESNALGTVFVATSSGQGTGRALHLNTVHIPAKTFANLIEVSNGDISQFDSIVPTIGTIVPLVPFDESLPDSLRFNPSIRKIDTSTGLSSTELDGVLALSDTVQAGLVSGHAYWFDGSNWAQSQQKPVANQPPKFDVVDSNYTSLSNTDHYTASTFSGCNLFSYKVGAGNVNEDLGFPISYRNINNVGDIEFVNNFDTDSFNYLVQLKTIESKINAGFIASIIDRNTLKKTNIWTTKVEKSKQYQIIPAEFDGFSTNFQIDILPDESVLIPNLKVFVNSKELAEHEFAIIKKGALNYVTIYPPMVKGDHIDILIYSSTQVSSLGYYEIPNNLNLNTLNQNFSTLTHGQFRNHLSAIASNCNELTGPVPGNSNLRDLNIKNYGGDILQHSAPLIYSELFLLNKDLSFIDSATYAQKEYSRFKNRFLESFSSVADAGITNPAAGVDHILHKINIAKNSQSPWYYSDMVPYDENKTIINYTVLNTDINEYEIDEIFSDTELSNKAILIYVNGSQLTKGIDYSFNQARPSIIFACQLNYDDAISINIYKNTDGCYIPETPTKLGLYPKFTPAKYVDDTYSTPIIVIRGHDGSITPAFNDIRDELLLELEKRIYNNIKIAYDTTKFDIYHHIPGKFRSTSYNKAEFDSIISNRFMAWINNNRTDYSTNLWFDSNNKFSWTYSGFRDILTNEFLPGYWRGIYKYFYDTDAPHIRPWESLGFSEQPDWWITEYGPAPYTGGNMVLWGDLEKGLIKQGPRAGTYAEYARPGLSKIIPVTDSGVLKAPDEFLVTAFNGSDVAGSFVFGDESPVETAWRRSSDYPYAVQQALALMVPAVYFSQLANVSRYSNNNEMGQFIVDGTNQRFTKSDFAVNGEILSVTADIPAGTIVRNAGYLNWIADYITGYGANAAQTIHSYLDNLQVRLGYRVAGYTDKPYLSIYADQVSPNSSTTDSVVIPDNNYQVFVHKSTPIDRLVYSAVIIEKTSQGFSVSGYSADQPYFTIIPSNPTNNKYTISAAGATGIIYNDTQSVTTTVPYGNEFTNKQQVVDFLISYGRYLSSQGFKFDEVDANLQVTRDWILASKEFLTWTQQGWTEGNILVVSPIYNSITVDSGNSTVDEITNLPAGSKILDVGFNVIKSDSFTVIRDLNYFNLKVLRNVGVGLIDINLVQYEHALIFDNVTVFNDIIYKPELGNRQYRLRLIGDITSSWSGQFNPPGLIYSNPNVDEWQSGRDYRQGELVSYNSYLYTALQNLAASDTFVHSQWEQINQSAFKTGMLPNLAYNASKFENMYDVDNQVSDQNINDFAMGLIGYRDRSYLTELRVDSTSQVKFYQGFIKDKGTINAINALGSARFDNLGGELAYHEEWAFRVGEYGATQSNQFVEVKLADDVFTYDPIALTFIDNGDVVNTNGVIGIADKDIFKKTPAFTKKILGNRNADTNTENDIKLAGFANLNDVDATVFDIQDTSSLNALLPNLIPGYKIWVAKDTTSEWNVYRICENPMEIIGASYQLNGYAQLTFNDPHGLKERDIFAVRSFEPNVDGFYTVVRVDTDDTVFVQISKTLEDIMKVTPDIEGSGVFFNLHSLRIKHQSDLTTFTPNSGWRINDRVWVDEADTSANWGVYEKCEPWSMGGELAVDVTDQQQNSRYGSAISSDKDGNIVVIGAPTGGDGSAKVFIKSNEGIYYSSASVVSNESLDISAPNYTLILSTNTYTYTTGLFLFDSEMTITVISDLAGGMIAGLHYNINYAEGATQSNSITFTANPTNGETITVIQTQPSKFGTAISVSNDTVAIGSPGSYNGAGRVAIYKAHRSGVLNISQVIGFYSMTASPLLAGDKFGTTISLSADTQWLYVGATDSNNHGAVYAFMRKDENITPQTLVTLPGVVTYELDLTTDGTPVVINSIDLGIIVNTPFNTLLPYVDYTIANNQITFAKDPAGVTVQIAKNAYYDFVNKISAPDAAVGDKFGAAIAATNDGSCLIVGAPEKTVGTTVGAGQAYSFNRFIQEFIADGTTSSFTLGETPSPSATYYLNNVKLVLGQDATVVGNVLTFTVAPLINSVIRAELNNISVSQLFNVSNTLSLPYNSKFGSTVAMAGKNHEVFIGASGYQDNQYRGGQIYRFNNNGAQYKTIIGKDATYPILPSIIYINGIIVGVSGTLANVISSVNDMIPGITASNVNGQLKITYASTSHDDTLTVVDKDNAVGMKNVYSKAQIIRHPNPNDSAFFASAMAYDENTDTLVASGIGATSVTDFKLDNFTTTFDSHTTTFIDTVVDTGAIYIFEELHNPIESEDNPSLFSYAQSLNVGHIQTGDNFGSAVALSNGLIFAGANESDSTTLLDIGRVYHFANADRRASWNQTRIQTPKVDIENLSRVYLYDRVSQSILSNLDFIDPAKGKILGVAAQDINFRSSFDPARYNTGNNSNVSISADYHWGKQQVGQVWWNLDAMRYIDYEQGDLSYRIAQWGTMFPGSKIEINEWVESSSLPSKYAGDGNAVYPDDSAYVQSVRVDPVTGIIQTKYYFWVANRTHLDPALSFRRSTSSAIANMISDPSTQNIPYAAMIRDDSVMLIDSQRYISDDRTVMHIDYSLLKNDNVIHNEYELVQENSPTAILPAKVVNKMVDSIIGADQFGNVVPDISLNAAEKFGISIRPRQTMFANPSSAARNLVTFCNTIFLKTPVVELFDISGLYAVDPAPTTWDALNVSVGTPTELTYLDPASLTVGQVILVEQDPAYNNGWALYQVQADKSFLMIKTQTYQTTNYWSKVDWFEQSYDATIKPTFTVETTADMGKLTPSSGDIIRVNNNGAGLFVIYRINDDLTSSVVGIQEGTIQLSDALWDHSHHNIGFDNDRFDVVKFDLNPTTEFRNIIETLRSNIFVDTLDGEFNNLFFMLLNYALSEQRMIDWAFKTSFVSVIHKLRKLEQYPNYIQDNQTYYEEYINEVKPYRTTVREYVLNYEGIDNGNIHPTDFDLPSYVDPITNEWTSPSGEHSADAAVLETDAKYADWNANHLYSIDSVIISDAGYGYAQPPVLLVQGGGGSGAELVAEIDSIYGNITGVTVVKPGKNYSTTPTIIVIGSGVDGTGEQTCKLYPLMKNNLVRSFDTSLKFDRVSYTSPVKQWTASSATSNVFYNIGDTVSFNSKAYSVNNIPSINSGLSFGVTVAASDIIAGQDYTISSIGNTDFTKIGAPITKVSSGHLVIGKQYKIASTYIPVSSRELVVGQSYTIVSLGTTDFTKVGAISNTVGDTFIATGAIAGTGTATIAKTDFMLVGAPNNNIGTVFTATGPGTGTGSAILLSLAGITFTATENGTGTGSVVYAQNYTVNEDNLLFGATPWQPNIAIRPGTVVSNNNAAYSVNTINSINSGTTFDIADYTLLPSELSLVVTPANLVVGQSYTIKDIGNTDFTTLGANVTYVTPSTITVGKKYKISMSDVAVGTTPLVVGEEYEISANTAVDYMSLGAINNTVGTSFFAANIGVADNIVGMGGTVNLVTRPGDFLIGNTYTISSTAATNFTAIGAANNNLGTVFTAGNSGMEGVAKQLTKAANLIVGNSYTITTVGTTDFTLVGAPITSVSSGNLVIGNKYKINNVSSTISAGNFNVGQTYTVSTVGSTDFTTIGAPITIVPATALTVGNVYKISSTTVDAGNLVAGETYTITEIGYPLGTTDFTLMGAPIISVAPTMLENSKLYKIVSVGTTDFMLAGAPNNNVDTIFAASGPTTGTGQVVLISLEGMTFTATAPGPGVGMTTHFGSTDFTLIGAANNNVGTIFTATGTDTGSGVTINLSLEGTTFTATGTGTGSGTATTVPTDFTLVGAANNNVDTIFTATGVGVGTGVATLLSLAGTSFVATGAGAGTGTALDATAANITVKDIVVGNIYQVISVGSTRFQVVGATTNTVGEIFTATATSQPGAAIKQGTLPIAATAMSPGNSYQVVTRNGTDYTSVGSLSNLVGTVFTATGPWVSGGVVKYFGTTDYTQMGAMNNAPGTIFTATALGTGTGTLVLISLEGIEFVATTIGSSTDNGLVTMLVNDTADNIVVGKEYMITYVGNTNFMLLGSLDNTVGTTFVAIDVAPAGSTGKVSLVFSAAKMVPGNIYQIVTAGTTDFTLFGAINSAADTTFIATGPGYGTGTVAIPQIIDWLPNTTYQNGEIVLNSNSAYLVTPSLWTGSFFNDPDYTILVDTTIASATNWAANTVYAISDIVLHEGKAYTVTPRLYSGLVFETSSYTRVADDQLANAADRVMALYSPTAGQPPKNLGKIFAGTEYPGNIVDGSAFTHSTSLAPLGITPAGSLLPGNMYRIETLGNTDFTQIGAISNTVGEEFIAISPRMLDVENLQIGDAYVIQTVGNTNFTLIGASANSAGVSFVATGVGSGTGTVLSTIKSGELTEGSTYEIVSTGSSDFTLVGATTNAVGTTFTATGIGSGVGLTGASVPSGNLVLGQMYSIVNAGTSDFTLLGASSNKAGVTFIANDIGSGLNINATVKNSGSYVIGQTYTIKEIGTTNFTLIGAKKNKVGLSFVATGIGAGTGNAENTLPAAAMVAGLVYTIKTIETTDYTLYGAPRNVIGLSFVATARGLGTGTVTSGSGTGTAYVGSGTGTVIAGSGTGLVVPGDGVGIGTGTASRVIEYTADNGDNLAIDTKIQSSFTDLALGTRPEDINIDGGAFVDLYSSHAPEELVPGTIYDTLDIKVFTVDPQAPHTNPLGYRISKTMDIETDKSGAVVESAWEFRRICANSTTTLAKDLNITDSEIFVTSVLNLPEPSSYLGIPGVVYINSEKITYYTLNTVTKSLGQIRRGVWGTAAPLTHTAGSLVVDASIEQKIPGDAMYSSWLDASYDINYPILGNGLRASSTIQAEFLKDCPSYLPFAPGETGVFVDPNAHNTRFDDDGAGQINGTVHPFDIDDFDSYVAG